MDPLSVGDQTVAWSWAHCGCPRLLDWSVSTLTLSVAYDIVHCNPLHVRIGGGTAKVFAETKG